MEAFSVLLALSFGLLLGLGLSAIGLRLVLQIFPTRATVTAVERD